MKDNNTGDKISIKKSAEKEIIYHYNREERLKRLKLKSELHVKKGFFRKNKVLIIIIIDIFLLIIVFLSFRFLFHNIQAQKTTSGYTYTLSSFLINDKAFSKVKIKRTHKTNNKNPIKAKVRFYQEKGNSVVKEVFLPEKSGESIDISATFVILQDNNEIHAEVSIKDNSFILSAIPIDR